MHAHQVQCTKIALCELWHFVQDSGIPGAPPGITLCLDSDFRNPGQMDDFIIFYQKKSIQVKCRNRSGIQDIQ